VSLVGIGALAGIGFTVSLFIAEESLTASALAEAKIGVLVSAVAAVILGAATIAWVARGRAAPTMPGT
jgi:NhaA family Na+:H+ antiporter